jgi:hypothetical protein
MIFPAALAGSWCFTLVHGLAIWQLHPKQQITAHSKKKIKSALTNVCSQPQLIISCSLNQTEWFDMWQIFKSVFELHHFTGIVEVIKTHISPTTKRNKSKTTKWCDNILDHLHLPVRSRPQRTYEVEGWKKIKNKK